MTRLVLASDVHLTPGHRPSTASFLSLLTTLRHLQDSGQPQALFVLGDLFSFWVDRPLMLDLFKPVLAALACLSRAGCPVTLLQGNRDFGVGRILQESTGARLPGERLVLEHAGRRALLLHGDQLVTHDRRYQVFRRLVRSLPARIAARLLPSPLLLWTVRRLERLSCAEKSRKPAPSMDINLDAAGREAVAVNVDFLFHGHTHRPSLTRIPAAGRILTIFSLGSWGAAGGTVTVWPEAGEPALLDWQPPPLP